MDAIRNPDARFLLVAAATALLIGLAANAWLARQSPTLAALSVAVIGGVLLALFARLLQRRVLRPLAAAEQFAAALADGRVDPQPHRSAFRGPLGDALHNAHQRLAATAAAIAELRQSHAAGLLGRTPAAADLPGAYAAILRDCAAALDGHLSRQRSVLELISRYADGDLSTRIEPQPGEFEAVSRTMDAARERLDALRQAVLELSAAAADGDFSVRGDPSRFRFAFRDMVEGLNRLMLAADDSSAAIDGALSGISDGDLTRRIEHQLAGRFGRLQSSCNRMVEQLAGVVSDISGAAGEINRAAAEISGGNADLAARTEQQAANLEETASSVELLTSTVRRNADNSRRARQLAVGAADVAVRGGEVVGNVVTTMQAITASSRRIEDIIGVIDGIAFQTNILALNAAVEAARAGEQGRGFAVVASEVRSLAQRSAEAAKEIKALIAESVSTVDSGATLVQQAGRTMDEIVDAVKRVTEIMGEIAAASDEQTSGIEQVNGTIVQIDQATQHNTVLVERASATARALEAEANRLAKAVAAFRLDARSDRRQRPRAVGQRSADGEANGAPTTARGVAHAV